MTRRDVPDADGWPFDDDREQRQATLALAHRLDRSRQHRAKLAGRWRWAKRKLGKRKD